MQSRLIPYLLSRRDEYVTTSFARKDSELTQIFSKSLNQEQKYCVQFKGKILLYENNDQ